MIKLLRKFNNLVLKMTAEPRFLDMAHIFGYRPYVDRARWVTYNLR